MLSAILSFLGGSVFRMIFGEVAAWIQKKQDHAHELEMLRLQCDLEDRAAERRAAAIRLQADLNVREIAVQAEARAQELEMQGWSAAVANATARTGIFVVDVWNGVIRPSAATIALGLWIVALNAQSFRMSAWDRDLVGVILGFFFASRVMQQRGR